MKGARTRMRAFGWDDTYKGRRGRSVAAKGGDFVSGFISGVKALWASPARRRGRRRTVRRRS